MNRKHVVFVAFLLALCAAGAGESEYVIDSFEDGDYTKDLTWAPGTDQSGGPEFEIIKGDSDGPADGDQDSGHSLQVTRTESGWAKAMCASVPAAAIQAHGVLKVSVKTTDESLPENWLKITPVLNNSPEWREGPQWIVKDPLADVDNADGTWHTYEWDYSELRPELKTEGDIELILVSNTAFAPSKTAKYMIDYVRLEAAPESESEADVETGDGADAESDSKAAAESNQ